MTQMNLRTLRLEVRAWLSENIPDDLSLPGPDEDITPELEAWTRDFRKYPRQMYPDKHQADGGDT